MDLALSTDPKKSLQETYAPDNICFGCGPANPKGLRIRSFAVGEAPDAELVCEFHAEKSHEAFAGVVNGGILCTLMDCHGNWAAAYFLMRRDALSSLPSTVTADLEVKLKRPTASNEPLHLSARVISAQADRAVVDVSVRSGEKITATCRGTFVSVQPGHPAYHRW